MSPENPTFPRQLEWCFVALLAYGTVCFSTNHSLMLVVTCLVVLNGWISSRAASYFYSDLLLALDCTILALYFLLLHGVHRQGLSGNTLAYSSALAIAYFLWDWALLPSVQDVPRRRRYRLYMVLLALLATVHGVLSGVPYAQGMSENGRAAIYAGSWCGVLGLWHYDKWKARYTPLAGRQQE